MKNDLVIKLSNINKLQPNGRRGPIKDEIIALKNAGVNSVEDAHKVLLDKNSRAEIRCKVCWALGQLKDKRSIPLLLTMLKSNNRKIVWESAKAISFIGQKKVIRHLITILLSTKNLEKRKAIVYALGELRDGKALDTLVDILASPKENSNLRGLAAEALGKIGNKKAIPSLITALSDSKTELRFWSAFALGGIKDKTALPSLRILATKDKSILRGYGSVRHEALSAIKNIMR